MHLFSAEVEEHTDGWNRTKIIDLGTQVGEWVLIDPHPHSWYRTEVESHEGTLVSVQYKDHKTGYEDFVFDGSWMPRDLRGTLTGWGGKNEVRDIYPNETAYIYDGDLEYPEPYTRLAENAYSDKEFAPLEEVAAYWHALAIRDEELAGLYSRFMRSEEL